MVRDECGGLCVFDTWALMEICMWSFPYLKDSLLLIETGMSFPLDLATIGVIVQHLPLRRLGVFVSLLFQRGDHAVA